MIQPGRRGISCPSPGRHPCIWLSSSESARRATVESGGAVSGACPATPTSQTSCDSSESDIKYRPCDRQLSSTAPSPPADGACPTDSRATSNAMRVSSVCPAAAMRVSRRHTSIARPTWSSRDSSAPPNRTIWPTWMPTRSPGAGPCQPGPCSPWCKASAAFTVASAVAKFASYSPAVSAWSTPPQRLSTSWSRSWNGWTTSRTQASSPRRERSPSSSSARMSTTSCRVTPSASDLGSNRITRTRSVRCESEWNGIRMRSVAAIRLMCSSCSPRSSSGSSDGPSSGQSSVGHEDEHRLAQLDGRLVLELGVRPPRPIRSPFVRLAAIAASHQADGGVALADLLAEHLDHRAVIWPEMVLYDR